MTVIFAVVIALAAVSALGVVLSRQTIYSALSLVLTVTMLAVLFLLLNAQFLFAVQLIIYAGAVMVLFVFIVALLSPDAEDRPTLDLRAVIGILGVEVGPVDAVDERVDDVAERQEDLRVKTFQ